MPDRGGRLQDRKETRMRTDAEIEAFRERYPKACYKCGEALDGPGTVEEIRQMIEEHDRLFPGEEIDTSCVICDSCFHTYCPGGKKLRMD
jgi:hypothetical protein